MYCNEIGQCNSCCGDQALYIDKMALFIWLATVEKLNMENTSKCVALNLTSCMYNMRGFSLSKTFPNIFSGKPWSCSHILTVFQ